MSLNEKQFKILEAYINLIVVLLESYDIRLSEIVDAIAGCVHMRTIGNDDPKHEAVILIEQAKDILWRDENKKQEENL